MAEKSNEEQILDAFIANLENSSGTEQAPEAKAETPAQQPEAAAQNAQVEGEDAPTQGTVETAQEQDEVQTIEIDPDEPLFEQEIVEGNQKKTQKLSLKELQRGYIGNAETTRRFQEAARIKAEAQDAVKNAEQQAIKQSMEKLEQLQSYVIAATAPELRGVDWNKLANEDAFEYVRLSNRAKQINDALQAIESEKKQLAAKQNEEKQKSKAEQLHKTEEKLRAEIPEYGDQVIDRFIKQAIKEGYTREELSENIDSRLFKLAYKAALYDELQEKQVKDTKIVEKRIALVPKVLKPGAKSKPAGALDEAKSKLRKTGKPEDALPFFEALVR